MNAEHIFVDTNILVYAHDADAEEKHRVALAKVRALWDQPYPPAISVQVLAELYTSLTKKGASLEECRRITGIYLHWEVIPSNAALFSDGVALRERFQINLWDSLIVAAALRAKASVLWSEDLQAGQKFDGVTVVNPLK